MKIEIRQVSNGWLVSGENNFTLNKTPVTFCEDAEALKAWVNRYITEMCATDDQKLQQLLDDWK